MASPFIYFLENILNGTALDQSEMYTPGEAISSHEETIFLGFGSAGALR